MFLRLSLPLLLVQVTGRKEAERMGEEVVDEAGRESQEIMMGQVDTWKNQSLGVEEGEHLKLERGEQTMMVAVQVTPQSRK